MLFVFSSYEYSTRPTVIIKRKDQKRHDGEKPKNNSAPARRHNTPRADGRGSCETGGMARMCVLLVVLIATAPYLVASQGGCTRDSDNNRRALRMLLILFYFLVPSKI